MGGGGVDRSLAYESPQQRTGKEGGGCGGTGVKVEGRHPLQVPRVGNTARSLTDEQTKDVRSRGPRDDTGRGGARTPAA